MVNYCFRLKFLRISVCACLYVYIFGCMRGYEKLFVNDISQLAGPISIMKALFDAPSLNYSSLGFGVDRTSGFP